MNLHTKEIWNNILAVFLNFFSIYSFFCQQYTDLFKQQRFSKYIYIMRDVYGVGPYRRAHMIGPGMGPKVVWEGGTGSGVNIPFLWEKQWLKAKGDRETSTN